jgi:hypothetical protein
MKVTLNAQEISVLMLQEAKTRNNGGFQNLMLSLQDKLDKATGELELSAKDLKRIPKYAFDYSNGGWQDRLTAIFSRTLGPTLGR